MSLLLNDLLTPLYAGILIAFAFFGSFITAAFGAGGGLLLLLSMASILPMSIVIPVHGLVQLGSNATRAIATFRYIDLNMLAYFSVGGLIGAVLSTTVLTQIALEPMKIVLAIFIFYLLWGPKPKFSGTSPSVRFIAGLSTAFLSVFVGASGPIVSSYLYTKEYEKLKFTATFSSCMALQHVLKAAVFSVVGFAFFNWLPLIFCMVISGVFGTFVGLHVLNKTHGANFRKGLRLILSFLSLHLIWQGVRYFYN